MNADEMDWLLQMIEESETAKRFVQAQYERARMSHEVMANVEEGALVVIAGWSQQGLDRAVTTIGENVSVVLTDVSKLDDIDNLYQAVAAQEPKIDIVFANSGFVETQGSSRRHRRAFRQNLRYQRAASISPFRRHCH